MSGQYGSLVTLGHLEVQSTQFLRKTLSKDILHARVAKGNLLLTAVFTTFLLLFFTVKPTVIQTVNFPQ